MIGLFSRRSVDYDGYELPKILIQYNFSTILLYLVSVLISFTYIPTFISIFCKLNMPQLTNAISLVTCMFVCLNGRRRPTTASLVLSPTSLSRTSRGRGGGLLDNVACSANHQFFCILQPWYITTYQFLPRDLLSQPYPSTIWKKTDKSCGHSGEDLITSAWNSCNEFSWKEYANMNYNF